MNNRPDFLVGRAGHAVGKTGFVNRALGFANLDVRLARTPHLRLILILNAAAAAFAIIAGAFGTGTMPFGTRSLFWIMLIGWNFAKWQIWFAFTVRRPADWSRAALGGAVVLNLTLPVEISLCLRAVGVRTETHFVQGWLYALLISLILGAIIWTVTHWAWRHRTQATAPMFVPPEDGLLIRAGVSPDALTAIQAEDHYCRVQRQDGSSVLVHYRFSDAVNEMAGLAGAQIHRGTWVAASAVRGAIRRGRRWHLLLADGISLPVSTSRVAEVRRLGWLRRTAQSMRCSS